MKLVAVGKLCGDSRVALYLIQMLLKFQNPLGECLPSSLDLPLSSSILDLHKFLNELLCNSEEMPYTFYFGAVEIKKSLQELVGKLENWSAE